MSMLAGPKRKQKWTLNPRGKHWSEDSNKFGQKMLEKMGWTHGKGLGAKEQGMIEHIRVKVKNDQVGIGFDKNRDDQWTEHQDVFNNLLQNLQKEQSTETVEENDKVLSGKSLEEKSKQSQKRVHYKKFTQGKDVNKYSTKDLANIFGKKDLNEKSVKEDKKEEEVFYDPVGTEDTTAGILTIKGGNISDYFYKKLHTDDYNHSSQNKEDNLESESEQRHGFGFSVKSKSKFYVNNATDPDEGESISETEKYVGFGFTKNSDVKPKVKNINNLNYVFDNPCLDLNILDDSHAKQIKTEVLDPEYIEKITPKEQKNEFIYDNGGLDLNCPDKSTPKKRKYEAIYDKEDTVQKSTSKKAKKNKNKSLSNIYENPALDLEFPDKPKNSDSAKENSLLNGINNPALDLDCPDRPTPQKPKKIKSESLSNGIENPGLDLDFPDRPTPQKAKKIKRKSLSNGIENPGLNLDFPNRPTLQKDKKIISESLSNRIENQALDLECPDRPSPQKAKKIKSECLSNGIENQALDLDCPDRPTLQKNKKTKSESLSNGIENPALDLDCPDRPTPQKAKKIKSKSLSNGIENSGLDLNFPDRSIFKKIKSIKNESSFDGYENPALDLEYLNKSEDVKSTKLKSELLSEGYENLAMELDKSTSKKIKQKFVNISDGIGNLALDLEFSDGLMRKNNVKHKTTDVTTGNSVVDFNNQADEVLSTSNFEVLRCASGMRNNAFDDTDETVNKKRVTFNEHVEYNTDIIKKKKKKKKLDKHEFTNEKLKKKRKTIESSIFLNEALDEEAKCAEEFDNEINEKRSKKGKRRKERRISLLETIEEAPEDENSNETVTEQAKVPSKKTSDIEVIGEFACSDIQIISSKNSIKKNKKKKKIVNSLEAVSKNCNFEENCDAYVDVDEEISEKKKKKKRVKKETNKEFDSNNQFGDYEKENIHDDRDAKNITISLRERNKKKSDDDIISLEEFLNEEESLPTKSKLEKQTSENAKKKSVNTEVIEEKIYEEHHFSYQKFKTTKQVMKSLFLKNPSLMFNGSNINDIKGYGAETHEH